MGAAIYFSAQAKAGESLGLSGLRHAQPGNNLVSYARGRLPAVGQQLR
jgi:hypothetical protein